MVKLLFLKMLRDMKKSLAAYGICLLIVGVGFCGFCVMSVAKDHLLVSRDLLYEKSAFTEGFAEVYEAPTAIKDKLADIPGIGEVQARIIKEARLTDIGDGNARLKLISYEKGGRNVPMLFRGTDVKAGELQVVAGNAFLEARSLAVGTKIHVLVSGKDTELEITGGGISPENIYIIRNIVDMYPDAANYDVGFVDQKTMESLYGMKDMANSFAFDLDPGYTIDDVKDCADLPIHPGALKYYQEQGVL